MVRDIREWLGYQSHTSSLIDFVSSLSASIYGELACMHEQTQENYNFIHDVLYSTVQEHTQQYINGS